MREKEKQLHIQNLKPDEKIQINNNRKGQKKRKRKRGVGISETEASERRRSCVA